MTGPMPPTHAGRHFPIEPLTAREVSDLIASIPGRSTQGIRLRAVVALLYGAGLRVSECLRLQPQDVDTRAGVIRVHQGKGGEDGTVGIDVYSCVIVDRWVDVRTGLGPPRGSPLIMSVMPRSVGQPLRPRDVRAALSRAGRRAGIRKRVHPHGLRHSLAFDMAQRGIPTHVIQAQLRHSTLAVTDRYVRHIMPADLIATMRGRDWSDASTPLRYTTGR